MLIAIPSKSRPYKSKTKELFKKNGILYVPASEEEYYRKIYNEVVPVPDDIRGITATRNWILRNTTEERVVFVDDDMKCQGRYVAVPGEYRIKRQRMTEEEWMIECERMFDLCDGLGWKIFGINTESNKISYRISRPLSLRGYVLASFMGVVNDGSLYFDETFRVKEDYELCLRHIKLYGGILRAKWLHWENTHWQDDGGCKDYRSDAMERECIRRLTEMYPSYVRSVANKSSQYTIKLQFN